MIISTAGSRTSRRWKRQEVSWDWLLERLRTPKRTGETVAEYRRMTKDEQAQRKDVGGFVGGEVVGGRRVAGSVHERWLLTLDADDANPADWQDWTCLFDYRAAVYSTHSHTPESPRLRWIIPLARPVGPEEYQAIARKVAETIGIETMDVTTYQPERLMYWPSCPEDGEYLFEWQDGPLLQPDQVLRQYGPGEAWRNAGAWPISSKEQAVILREARHQGAPEQKPGVVGKFCRAFSVPEAIDRWLSDKYEECDNAPGRYTYRPGSSSGGAVLYDDDRFLYSHHATDPAGGQLCNAFDLVRVHLFGEQDAGHEQQEITRRPSYQAMCDMVRQDDECKRRFFAERIAEVNQDFADLGEIQNCETAPEHEPSDDLKSAEKAAGKGTKSAEKGANDQIESGDDQIDDAWLAKLTTNRKTGEAERTIENAVLILANDPKLKGAFGQNEFIGLPCIRADLPWRRAKAGALWEDADEANLRLYLERKYGFVGKDKINDALSITLKANAYHPVREYLQGLEWDGVERLDTLLVRYMGAEDNAYVRAVTRKWMVAAVKRVMQPGCKFDGMLVLVGNQGIGKSRLGLLLSKGWFSDSLTRMDGKEAYESIRGSWIIEVAELAAARRSEQEAHKKFLSAQSDRYRPAYGRNIVEYPRQCVFLGSTNDMEPLKDDTGARRYWPVLCSGVNQGQHIGLEQEVDQLWAEAVVRYRAGESIWLDDAEVAKEADVQQAMMTAQDEFVGMVEEFLGIKLPEDWESRSPEDRRAYIAGDTLEKPEVVGKVARNRISIVELRVECFGERRDDIRSGRDGTTRHLSVIMRKQPGWHKYKSLVRIPGYGPQWVYFRDGFGPDELAKKRMQAAKEQRTNRIEDDPELQ